MTHIAFVWLVLQVALHVVASLRQRLEHLLAEGTIKLTMGLEMSIKMNFLDKTLWT
jgi:hypothetical protein